MLPAKDRKSSIINLKSSISRLWREEDGQGLIFAAAGMILLVMFVALVYNVGHLVERRTKAQVAADACAYSGAVVVANSLSAIGWINSAMAQIYYNACKYAVDVNVAGVAAHLEWQQAGKPAAPSGQAYDVYSQAYRRAAENIPLAKQVLADLSRIQNAIAILTPRMAEEEMYAVGARAGTVGEQRGAERLSLFPSLRLFPRGEGTVSYRVEQLTDGWRITNLSGGNNEMISLRLVDGEWRVEYSTDGIVRHEVIISEEDAQGGDELERWAIRYYQPPGNLVQEIILVHTTNLGWVVWGTDPGSGDPMPAITFDPVNMIDPPSGPAWTAGNEGTRVTYEDTSQVFARRPNNDLYAWDPSLGAYVNMTSDETTVAGVRVRINVTNTIHFPYGSARIGDPVHVWIGNTELILRNPPTIRTGLGPISITVTGFDPDSFSVSAGGFSLTHGDADGIWRKHYNRHEEYWWQHRLTEQVPEDSDALRQWQYDRQTIGAHLQEEPVMERYAVWHAIEDRHGEGNRPPWFDWFDPIDRTPREADYYRTAPCGLCGGTGANPDDPQAVCPRCRAQDHDQDGVTDVRSSIADLLTREWRDATAFLRSTAFNPGWGVTLNDRLYDFIDAAGLYTNAYAIPAPRRPLVLSPEFFRFGLNVGAWRQPSTPMLFPLDREPDWGFVAVSSARIGIPDPTAEGGYREFFDDKDSREVWCNESRWNLYTADARPRLVPSRDQVKDFELQEEILIGTSLRPTDESGLSYLWDAVLGAGRTWEHSNWLAQYDGRPDFDVSARIRNMRDRRERRFNFRSARLNEVVEH